MFRGLWVAVAVASGLFGASLPSIAGHATQTLAVSTQVTPSAAVGFEISAVPLVVTSADLDRGYVDVVMKSRMRVATAKNEARPAIVMGIEPRPDLFRAMSVASPGGDGNGNGHSSIGVPAAVPTGTGGETAEFRYRFEFKKAAREGRYETAITVAVDL